MFFWELLEQQSQLPQYDHIQQVRLIHKDVMYAGFAGAKNLSSISI